MSSGNISWPTGKKLRFEAETETFDVIGVNPTEVATHVGNALQLARKSLQEARHSVRALRPEALESGDRADALQRVVGLPSAGRPENFHFRLNGRSRPVHPPCMRGDHHELTRMNTDYDRSDSNHVELLRRKTAAIIDRCLMDRSKNGGRQARLRQ